MPRRSPRALREEAWKQYERLAQTTRDGHHAAAPPLHADARNVDGGASAGCLEYREAMGPNGLYGNGSATRTSPPSSASTLFMHAGLNPSRPAPKTIDEVNEQARARGPPPRRAIASAWSTAGSDLPFFGLQEVVDVAVVELTGRRPRRSRRRRPKAPSRPLWTCRLLREAQEILEIAKWSLIDPEGPLWFRGYATWPEDTTAAQVTAFLDQMKLARIVVGHTPTTDRRIVARYGGRVVTIDTGMLASYYMGDPSALEIVGDTDEGDLSRRRSGADAAQGGARCRCQAATPSSTRASRPDALATAKLSP